MTHLHEISYAIVRNKRGIEMNWHNVFIVAILIDLIGSSIIIYNLIDNALIYGWSAPANEHFSLIYMFLMCAIIFIACITWIYVALTKDLSIKK